MIKLDKIKLIREKTNADYSEAMEVLNNCNEDVYKAITTIKASNKKIQKKNIKFVSGFKGKKVLEKLVNSKKYNLAFKLYPTNISQVISFAEKKKYMPQKSTWFHPKPLDGLISSNIIS